MNINHLAIFYAVYQEGSISIGAERLHISQPAVSKQLKELETSFKTALFDRGPKGVRPTEAGKLLSGYAHRIFALETEAETAMAELDGLTRGKLTIGASLTIGNYLLPIILSRFHMQYPGVVIDVEIANTVTVQNKLIEGTLDLGLTEGYVESADLEVEIFSEDELVPVAPPEHPIFESSPVSLERLCREDFVLRERGSGTREVMERAIAEQGYSLHAVMSLGDIEAVKRAVAAGIGIGIISGHALSMELAAGILRRIDVEGFTVKRPLHFLTSRKRYRSKAVQALTPLIMNKAYHS